MNKFMKIFDEILDCLLFEIHLTGSEMNEMLHDTQIRINEHFSITIFRVLWFAMRYFFSFRFFLFSSFQLDEYRFFNFEKLWNEKGMKKQIQIATYIFGITDSINFPLKSAFSGEKKRVLKQLAKCREIVWNEEKMSEFENIQWIYVFQFKY